MTGDRSWTNHAAGYYVCGHIGCSKKANRIIVDHDCCGRCNQGRLHLNEAMVNYDGPGAFAHKYWEALLSPGVCATCGVAPGSH
jgi:hypothetical protein